MIFLKENQGVAVGGKGNRVTAGRTLRRASTPTFSYWSVLHSESQNYTIKIYRGSWQSVKTFLNVHILNPATPFLGIAAIVVKCFPVCPPLAPALAL